jgi:hypothetical protein
MLFLSLLATALALLSTASGCTPRWTAFKTDTAPIPLDTAGCLTAGSITCAAHALAECTVPSKVTSSGPWHDFSKCLADEGGECALNTGSACVSAAIASLHESATASEAPLGTASGALTADSVVIVNQSGLQECVDSQCVATGPGATCADQLRHCLAEAFDHLASTSSASPATRASTAVEHSTAPPGSSSGSREAHHAPANPGHGLQGNAAS